MLLAIDAGNSNIVFALFDGDRQLVRWRLSTNPDRTSDEYAVWLTQLMQLRGYAPRVVTGAIVASVVPGATEHLRRLCQDHFGRAPLVIGDPGVELGIKAVVDRPAEVGADRLCNAAGVAGLYPLPAVVIDFGTATNFDMVDRDGNYCGGVIAPGVNLSLDALHHAAAKLPRIEVARPPKVIGRDTISCMQSGVYWGYIGLIEGVVGRLRDEIGVPLTRIATGGMARLFAGATASIDHVDGEVTLRGLQRIYMRNATPNVTADVTS